MSFVLLDQLTGPLANVQANFKTLHKSVKYGIKADVDLSLTGEFTHQFNRRGALFSNMLSPFGILKAHMVEDVANFSGTNVRFINDDGRIDEKCIFDALKLNSYFRTNTIAAISPLIATLGSENHVSVLINMLRVSRILKSKPADFEVKPTDLFYDDGHLNISYGNFLKRSFEPWTGLNFNLSFIIVRYDENESIHPDFYCPNLENLTTREFNIFCTLIGEIECSYPLRIAFGSQTLVNTLYLPATTKHGVNYELVNNMTDVEVDIVMRKYIFANRVSSDFDLAYLTVVNAMFAPLPRSAEAHGWISPLGHIYLPKVSSVRGFMGQLTQGSPYEPHPDRALTWAGYANQPDRMLIHAIAACEAFYTGLFEILTSNPYGVEHSLYQLGITSFETSTPYKLFCEATSYRFGKPFELLWDTHAGVDCYSHLLATTPLSNDVIAEVVDNVIDGYEVYETHHGGESTKHLVCRELKPALFPILSMGINDDRYFNNSLEYTTTLHLNTLTAELTTVSSDDANKAMSLFRLGGMNATLFDSATGRASRNWAANSNGQVVPVLPPGRVGASTYRFPIRYINARKNNWMTLPNIIDKLTMSAKINVKGYVIINNGKYVSGYMPRYRTITVYPKPLASDKMTALPMKTDPTALKYRFQGFSLAVSQPRAPVVLSQSLPMDITDLQQAEALAEEDGELEEV